MITENNIYTEQFKFKNRDGTEGIIEIRPLAGKHLPKLYAVVGKLREAKGSNAEVSLAALDENTMETLVQLCTVTIKRSFPSESDDKIDEFVSSHFLKLMTAIMSVNFRTGE